MVTMYAVVFTDDNGESTRHTAHRTQEDAVWAGADLAKTVWQDKNGGNRVPFPEHADGWEAMDVLRVHYDVRLEVEPIEIDEATIDALHAALHDGEDEE